MWMASPSLLLLTESPRYWARLAPLLADPHGAGPRVHDGRVAAICRDSGVDELWRADRDFDRVAGVRVSNPLATPGTAVRPSRS